ncbi:MAG: hypothetical protein FGM54_06160 [Chitinophagaceae bacterium]|nr:hypothetical protein [Chitinophagaceae bacterium]
MTIVPYPFPYKAWFTLASDPDFTFIDDWHELHNFIWKELELPLANSLFVKSVNANLPKQVNLVEFPEITQQPHDTIHTWGDYMHARKNAFDREDAVEAMQILKEHGIHPKVWIDHAKFSGNLLHNAQGGSIRETMDMSGHTYQNFVYTLDLIYALGIRYVWNGSLTGIIGQNRKLKATEYFNSVYASPLKAQLKWLMHTLLPKGLHKKLKAGVPNNQLMRAHTFPDGNTLYIFERYGKWKEADIYGLGNIITPQIIDTLQRNGGTMIAYTHLGKRIPGTEKEKQHIPEKTRLAFRHIQTCYEQKNLMVSSVSELLDYCVIRDHIKINTSEAEIQFHADGIRYSSIGINELKGKRFTFQGNIPKQENLRVYGTEAIIPFSMEDHAGQNCFTLIF